MVLYALALCYSLSISLRFLKCRITMETLKKMQDYNEKMFAKIDTKVDNGTMRLKAIETKMRVLCMTMRD